MPQVVRALNLVALENTPSVTIRQKLAFFNETRHSMGRSALMLSGGASFGCYHVGVIKALHENRLLPKIISGASAGAIIASWVGAMTDEELDHVTDPGRVNLDLFPPITGAVFRKLYRLLNTGVVFDVRTLARCLRANIGDITFAEAYARSGRVTNIVVAPANSSKEVPRLLNYLTSPDVVLWSAAVASSAIPYFYESVELQMKDSRTGKIVPYYTRGVRWSDGSFHSDLPMKRLAELFNVNMYIVSQVNPHVIPFAVRKEWRVRSIGGVLVHLCTYLGEQLRHTIMLLFQNATLVLPAFGRLTIIPAAFGQTYTGDITILPDFRPSDYLFLLSNPTPERLQDCTRRTEVLTWRKLAEVKHACEIEFALDACVRYMRGAILMSNEVTMRVAAHVRAGPVLNRGAHVRARIGAVRARRRHPGQPSELVGARPVRAGHRRAGPGRRRCHPDVVVGPFGVVRRVRHAGQRFCRSPRPGPVARATAWAVMGADVGL